MSLQCYQEAQKSPHFRSDVLLFMVIYVWICLRCVEYYLKDDDDALLFFAHQKKRTAGSKEAEAGV